MIAIINPAIPREIIFVTYFTFKLKYCFFIFNIVFFPVRKRNVHNAEINCEITVAKAAPLTPKSSPKIKIGSKIILTIAPSKTAIIPILANP